MGDVSYMIASLYESWLSQFEDYYKNINIDDYNPQWVER